MHLDLDGTFNTHILCITTSVNLSSSQGHPIRLDVANASTFHPFRIDLSFIRTRTLYTRSVHTISCTNTLRPSSMVFLFRSSFSLADLPFKSFLGHPTVNPIPAAATNMNESAVVPTGSTPTSSSITPGHGALIWLCRRNANLPNALRSKLTL